MLQERLVETQVCWALDETRERERVYPTFSLSSFDILRASVATCCKCSPQAFPRVAAYTPHRWSCPWQPLSQRWELDVWGMMSLMPDMGQNRATNKEIGQPFKHDVFGLWLWNIVSVRILSFATNLCDWGQGLQEFFLHSVVAATYMDSCMV